MTDLQLATRLTEALVPTYGGTAWLAMAAAAPELPWATALELVPADALGKGWTEDRKIRLLEQLP